MIEEGHVYDQDILRTQHNHEFMNDPDFQAAYARGVQATGMDYQWHWRVHVGLWAAQLAMKLRGDFIECGVAKGFLSSAIMQFLDWSKTGRTFYLLDTFCGTDLRYVTPTELAEGAIEKSRHLTEIGLYPTSPESVIKNFAKWDNVEIIVGSIPETLSRVATKRIAFLHIDMNCTAPEVAALSYFWDDLAPGAPILLDDYAFFGYRQQKLGMDRFAATKNVTVLSLPTGQGLIIKPPGVIARIL